MKMSMNFVRGATAALVLLITACGGGGGGGGESATSNNASAPTPTVVAGAITGFGSVIVAGKHFDTAGSSIRIDDRIATESELRVGQIVRLEGSFDDRSGRGSARSIEKHSLVEGPVQAIDAAAGTLVVLGQSVRVDAVTHFGGDIRPASLGGLVVGDIVEISGFRDASQVILATRIEKADRAGELEVRGLVAQLDAAAKRFRIAGLTVDYGSAQLDDLPGGAPADGQLVAVKGTTLDAAGALIATRVEGEDRGMNVDDNRHVEVEGLVTRFASSTDFDVDGQRVTTDAATRFERGSAANLALNVRVEVEGRIVNDVLRAEVVKFEIEANLRLTAPVQSVEAAAGRFTALGVVVETNAGTRFEDKTDAEVRDFNVVTLRAGDWVEVRGVAGSAANTILASRVERDDAEDEVELRGPAENVAAPALTILGVSVMTNASTQFEDAGDARIEAAAFFARAPGQMVEADGLLQGSVLVAHEIELEGDDEDSDGN